MSPDINLSDQVGSIIYQTVRKKYVGLLRKIKVKTVVDLLNYYPTRYEDYSLISNINQIQAEEIVTVIGTVKSFSHVPTRKRGFTLQETEIFDESGKIKLIWFNQPFLTNIIKVGQRISAAGTVEQSGRRLTIKNPEYELIYSKVSNEKIGPKDLIHTGRLVPIYPETKGLTSKWLRSKIAQILNKTQNQLIEWLPPPIVNGENLISIQSALKQIHFPDSTVDFEAAKNRLEFEELIRFQLISLVRKREWKKNRLSRSVSHPKQWLADFQNRLEFKLTDDQLKTIDDIFVDLEKPYPMNRLIEGDVGSGKTAVAAAAAFSVIKSGLQVAFMAPTQVLADQHATTLTNLLKPFGIKIALLTGGTRAKISEHSENSESQNVKPSDYLNIRQSGTPSIPSFPKDKPDLIIGTHALIHNRAKSLIDTKKLAFVIIDEQHRFGVKQRALLADLGKNPHILSMTATPIPRTVALTLYGDLDLSLIKEMPAGRLPVKTWVIPENKRASAYNWIKQQLKSGSQAFVVCPFIENSNVESLKSVKAALSEYQKLAKIFSGFKLGLIHGKIPPKEKTEILLKMKSLQYDLVVATPVVEVGVDVPNAAIMVIEGAERFGLAQLHQLRGRVGRDRKQSYCLLFSSDDKEIFRLRALEKINSGFELSELDLKFRGPGEFWNVAQHGWPEFKIADLSNLSLVSHIHQVASELIKNFLTYPGVNRFIKSVVVNQVAPN